MAAPYGGVAEKIRRGGSDDDVDSDAEEEYGMWIPSKLIVKGVNQTKDCKGCGQSFRFQVAGGQRISDSKSVQEFYSHCLEDCPAYMELCKLFVLILKHVLTVHSPNTQVLHEHAAHVAVLF